MLPTAKTNAKVAPPLRCEIFDFYRATVMRVTDGADQELLSRVSTAVPGHLDTQHTFRTHDGLVMQLYVANTDGEQTGSALGIPHTWRDPTLELADYEPRSVRFMQHSLEHCDIKIRFNNNDQEAETLRIDFHPPGCFTATASPSLPQEGAIASLVATLVAGGAERCAQTERVAVDVATPPLVNSKVVLDFVLPNIPSGAKVAREWDIDVVQLDQRYTEEEFPTHLQSDSDVANRIFQVVAHRWEAAAIHLVRLLERCAALAEPLARPMERRVTTLVPRTPETMETPPSDSGNKKKKRQRSTSVTKKGKKKTTKKRQKVEEEEEEEPEEMEEEEEEPAPKPPRKRLSLRKKTPATHD